MNLKNILILVGILCIGAFFRFYNVNWDINFHLHPDERFLTMIGAKETLPINFTQYLNPSASPLNPFVIGFDFFVYGVLPLTLNFLLSLVFHSHEYNLFALQGRILSGLFDLGALFFVYKIASLLEKKFTLPRKVRFFSAFFYAISVLPIQLSHFFTVDLFLSFFMLGSIYFLLLYVFSKNIFSFTMSGIFLGLALACKISALALLPLELAFLLIVLVEHKKIQGKFLIGFILFLTTAYLSLRFADPYLFASANFLDFRINTHFLHSIQTLTYYGNPNVWYPPNVQWANRLSVIFSLFNIVFFGLGMGLSLFMLVGIYALVKTKKVILLSLVAWVFLFFLYQSVQYVKTMRYFIFLYPFFAFFAGIGFAKFLELRPKLFLIITSICLILFWPLSFLSIYTKPHTRVAASDWINSTIPAGSTILGEYWDDPLPLVNKNNYNIILLHVFDTDTKEKWDVMNKELQMGQYLVLSSNRGWASIMNDAKSYPQMSTWYKDLFAGKLPYKKIKEFHSYPSLSYLGIPLSINDSGSEEAFTVYDHPVVMVFQKK